MVSLFRSFLPKPNGKENIVPFSSQEMKNYYFNRMFIMKFIEWKENSNCFENIKKRYQATVSFKYFYLSLPEKSTNVFLSVRFKTFVI